MPIQWAFKKDAKGYFQRKTLECDIIYSHGTLLASCTINNENFEQINLAEAIRKFIHDINENYRRFNLHTNDFVLDISTDVSTESYSICFDQIDDIAEGTEYWQILSKHLIGLLASEYTIQSYPINHENNLRNV